MKMKLEKSRSKTLNELYIIEILIKLPHCSGSEEVTMFHCRILLLPLLISLIYSITSSFDKVHIKHERPYVFSPDSHVTIGTIQQM